MNVATIVIQERTCSEDDFRTDDGSGMPEDTPVTVLATVSVSIDDVRARALDACIQSILDEYGVGQWDGDRTAYDPDGTYVSSYARGERSERWGRVYVIGDADLTATFPGVEA